MIVSIQNYLIIYGFQKNIIRSSFCLSLALADCYKLILMLYCVDL